MKVAAKRAFEDEFRGSKHTHILSSLMEIPSPDGTQTYAHAHFYAGIKVNQTQRNAQRRNRIPYACGHTHTHAHDPR